jgi:predicted phosphodiesterase
MNAAATTSTPMRIAVLSDIHGNLAALEAVVGDLERRGVDAVVNLGDSLSGPLLPLETARFLMARDWTQLAGNHERQLLTLAPEERGPSDAYAHSRLGEREFSWMAALPSSEAFDPEVFLCHGTPSSDVTYFLESVEGSRVRPATREETADRLGECRAPVVLCGHTHVARSVRSARGPLLVNPGSVGLQAFDDDRPHFHVVENGSPDARYAIIEKKGAAWASLLVSVPYDYGAMAELARKRERPDWDLALRTGYVTA